MDIIPENKKNTTNLISKTLHYIGQNHPNTFVIQIGAMDGVNFDDTRGFLNMYKWRSLLVEPIPSLFEELKENFKDRENYIFEQCAITEHDGEIEMLHIPPEVIEREGLHPGYKGMSAIYPLKNGFGSDYQRDIDVKSNFGVDIKVPSLTFDSLLKKHNISSFDILICDAEGYDWKIFNQLNLDKYRPKFIRLEYINLTDEEKIQTVSKLEKYGYLVDIKQDIDAVPMEMWDLIEPTINSNIDEGNIPSPFQTLKQQINLLSHKEKIELTSLLETHPTSRLNPSEHTIVTGLWDLSREGRGFEEHYLPNFKNMLQIDLPMVVFVPKELESFVKENRGNKKTHIKVMGLEDIKNLYQPFWDKTQNLRNDPDWLNITGEGGWLKTSPQATLEYYNPIVQSKMFMLHEAVCWNPFDTDYFFWLDAGITNTVSKEDLVDNNVLDVLPSLGNPFLFLSYPYESYEIHGFKTEGIEKIIGKKTEYVCRGGLFGGHKDQIRETNGNYYHLLMECFDRGYMGTEETIFTLLSYRDPHIYQRADIGSSGLIQNFINSVKEGTLEIIKEEPPINISYEKITDRNVDALKTHLYILTFNFPEQLEHTISSMKKTPEWLERPKLFLLDNSTDFNAKLGNREIAKLEGFEYIDLDGNRGINGGRQFAAEHFGQSDADFMFFFEDDMTSNPPELQGQFCRNGFRKHISNLYNIVHKIMLKEKFDFLKLSFTEVFLDNNTQTSWYNVPQSVRDSDWPHYPTLPTMGLDPNSPLTQFNNIKALDDVAYIDGEIYYSNWPMIVSKEGNQKMFLDVTWANPYEQTWMSYMYQQTKKGKLKPAVLLASPIWHDRIKHYGANERREN